MTDSKEKLLADIKQYSSGTSISWASRNSIQEKLTTFINRGKNIGVLPNNYTGESSRDAHDEDYPGASHNIHDALAKLRSLVYGEEEIDMRGGYRRRSRRHRKAHRSRRHRKTTRKHRTRRA